jgi:CheY-like chemotaxis protein
MADNLPVDGAPSAKPLRLLIAEDNPADLELTLRALKKSGLELEIETVAEREAFVEKLQSKPFDLVLSDYRTPGWTGVDANGPEAFARMSAERPDVPVVFCHRLQR